ncbi:MAG: hypothetical protein ABFS09_12435 [Thermodesulfobacteriota bacterium]
MAAELKTVLSQLAKDLPGFVAAAVVLVEDGLSLAEYTNNKQLEAGEASAYLASIVKSNRKAIKLLEGGQVTDDILITTDKNYFLIRHGADKPFFIFVMTSKNEWLGKARLLIKKYETMINSIMAKKTAPTEGN